MIEYVQRALDPIITKHDDEGDGLDVDEFLNMAAEATSNQNDL